MPGEVPLVLTTASAEETARVAEALAAEAGEGTVIGLAGDLGAGKTTFVRGFVKGAGGNPADVTSPTFTLMHEYAARLPIYHLDLYRLEDADEAREAGIEEILAGEEGVALVEWFSHAADLLPEDRVEVSIEIVDELHRRLRLQPRGASAEALLAKALARLAPP